MMYCNSKSNYYLSIFIILRDISAEDSSMCVSYMGANHGGLGGGLSLPPGHFTGGGSWQWTQPPQKNQVLAPPPTFRSMRGLTRLIVTVGPSTFFSFN